MTFANKIITLSNRITKSLKEKKYGQYCADPFESKHVQHLISLPHRKELLQQLPHGGNVAEIGVNKGDFSELILSITRPEKLFLIDVWATRRYHTGLFEAVQQRFAQNITSGQVEIVRDFSYTAIARFPDQYFDWVYLDTDHSLETTQQELKALLPKMKPHGIIAGHDYIVGNWNGGVRYGVMEAVREFCLQHDWEMIFLTHELDIPPSFAIRKIN